MENQFKLTLDDLHKSLSLPIKETNLVIYGSGFLAPDVPVSHNTGDAFKKVAEARHRINEKNAPSLDNKISYCPTDIEFFKTINNSHKINRLDVYCHGWVHGLNLGGFKGIRKIGNKTMDSSKIDWQSENQDGGKDLRRVETAESLYMNSQELSELPKLHPKAFSNSPKIFFWGCNIGGQLDRNGTHVAVSNSPYFKDPKKTFAQLFAERIGRGSVFALVGKGSAGGSMFKTDLSGNPDYSDGELLPANIALNHGPNGSNRIDATKHLKKFPL
ncbi:MAG: hypothetical protein OIF50_10750 [Flavobacteriaceae bacterium]|nr:hypothetical protein [Flavobacteriaceae bacterium]